MPTDTFTSSGQWTVPAGVTSATFRCWGGGAGGGGGPHGDGGGGGGGAFSQSVVEVTEGTIYDVAIGGGGAAETVGGDTQITLVHVGTIVLAKGGSPPTFTTGGAGGLASASTGDTKYNGGTGGDGTGAGAGGGGGGGAGSTGAGGNGSGATGGTGTSLSGGDGGDYESGGNVANPGSNYGGGGAGCAGGNSGAAGAPGLVTFVYGEEPAGGARSISVVVC